MGRFSMGGGGPSRTALREDTGGHGDAPVRYVFHPTLSLTQEALAAGFFERRKAIKMTGKSALMD